MDHAVWRTQERQAGQSLRSWMRSQGVLEPVSGSAYVHVVQYEYTVYGHLASVWEVPGTGPSQLYWQAQAVNINGQVTQELLGNGITTLRSYDAITGALLGTSSGNGNSNVQSMAYEWDLAGNLTKRLDARAGYEETFTYDGLYRLTGTQLSPTTSQVVQASSETYAYTALGRLTSRSDIGTYGYGVPGNIRAVRSVDRPGTEDDTWFCYDAAGNMVSQRSGTDCGSSAVVRQFGWTFGNRLRTATQASTGVSVNFQYRADGARFQQTQVNGSTFESTVYVGSLYERVKVTTGGQTTTLHRLYVRAGERVLAEEVIDGTGSRETRYWHRDHLGSVVAITTEDYDGGAYGGSTVGFYGVYSFDPWGAPRGVDDAISDPANWLSPSPSGVYNRGFTGHEMLPSVGLVHMNGRVYLPELGVFLSPDPFMQFPESTQGYNRYAYVGNNPLSYTDPSGHFIQFLKAALFVYNMFQSYQAGGFSGLIKGFLLSMAAAGIANSIGGHYAGIAEANVGVFTKTAVLTTSQMFSKALAHGVTQGMLSAAGGGRFKDGFLGGAVGSLANHMPLSENSNVRTIQTIVIGGTVSRLGGGKFANGAVSAAFVDLYNRLGHSQEKPNDTLTKEQSGKTVQSDGRDVVITHEDGTLERRSGGTRAWRNNNPGNIRSGAFADRNGAIGESGGFAVFASEGAGRSALHALLTTGTYQGLTVDGAIARYAPSNENHTATYQEHVRSNIGVTGSTPMNALTTDQLNQMAIAIRQMEGWRSGAVRRDGP